MLLPARASIIFVLPAPVPTFVTTSSAVVPAVSTTAEPHIVATAGFTYEQELFRTKWGWAAYDQVQKVLREETSD